MDIKNSLGKRTIDYEDINKIEEFPKYDYAKYGVLTKSLPKILFKGNSLLVSFLQLIDMRIIMTLKYIDKIKQFKWISWY